MTYDRQVIYYTNELSQMDLLTYYYWSNVYNERLKMTDRLSGGRGIGKNVFHLITITIYEETQNIGLSESEDTF